MRSKDNMSNFNAVPFEGDNSKASLWDRLSNSTSNAITDANNYISDSPVGDAIRSVNDFSGEKFNDASRYLGNASDAEKARLGFMASEQLSNLLPNKSDDDINRLNFIAENFGIGKGIKKKKNRSIASDLYLNELAKVKENNEKDATAKQDKWLEMLLKRTEDKTGTDKKG